MRDSPERDLAVANELGRMADARIRELESERREFQTLIRMCLQQFEFQYGKRQRGWDAGFLMDRCEALLGIQAEDTAIDSSNAFADYLPLSPVRIAPGEYAIRDRAGRTLWVMDGAALADWVCQSVNGYDSAVAAMAIQPWRPIETAPTDGTGFLVGLIGTDYVDRAFFMDSELIIVGANYKPSHWMPLPELLIAAR